jgi:hypothetical protein
VAIATPWGHLGVDRPPPWPNLYSILTKYNFHSSFFFYFLFFILKITPQTKRERERENEYKNEIERKIISPNIEYKYDKYYNRE